MKAIGIQRFNGREAMEIMELPVPAIGPKEILVKVHAAGVNPVDWKIREGLLQGRLPHHFPIVLGWDAAGTVESAGADVHDYQTGDEVFTYARKDMIRDGTYAEFVAVTPNHLSHKPKNLSFEEAAVVPLSSLTAYQVLFESLGLKAGEKILIHAGGGGVGGYAIPMAKQAGAHVITTASKAKHPYVQQLGADEVIDYHEHDFVDAVKKKHPHGIHAVFDTVGGITQLKSSQVLQEGGRITSILAIQKNFFTDKGLKPDYVFVHPDKGHLHKIKQWIEAGILRPKLATVFPLEEAARAHEMIEGGHMEGKIALKVL